MCTSGAAASAVHEAATSAAQEEEEAAVSAQAPAETGRKGFQLHKGETRNLEALINKLPATLPTSSSLRSPSTKNSHQRSKEMTWVKNKRNYPHGSAPRENHKRHEGGRTASQHAKRTPTCCLKNPFFSHQHNSQHSKRTRKMANVGEGRTGREKRSIPQGPFPKPHDTQLSTVTPTGRTPKQNRWHEGENQEEEEAHGGKKKEGASGFSWSVNPKQGEGQIKKINQTSLSSPHEHKAHYAPKNCCCLEWKNREKEKSISRLGRRKKAAHFLLVGQPKTRQQAKEKINNSMDREAPRTPTTTPSSHPHTRHNVPK